MNLKSLAITGLAAVSLPALAMLVPKSTAMRADLSEHYALRTTAPVVQPKAVAAKAQAQSLGTLKGRTFYGNLISHVDFNNYSQTEIPMGIYKFDISSDGVTDTPLLTNFAYDLYAGTYARTGFYGGRVASVFGYIDAVCYYDFDVENYVERRQNMVEANGTYELIPSVMCYDPLDDTIYALQYNEDLTGLYWSTFNRENLELEIIASWRSKFQLYAMAAHPNGYIYGISADGDLYKVNKKNGVTSYVGSTGVNVLGYNQSAIYDGLTNSLVWAAITDQGAALHLVDIETGEATLVQYLPNGQEIVGIYSLDNGAPADAPAAVSNLAVSYSEPGATSATITFNVPNKTYALGTLSGNVGTQLLVDGEIQYEGQCQPGQSVSVSMDLTNDNHYYCVVTNNDSGYSPYTYLYEYAGWDTPLPVTNVEYAIADGVANLNWEAPAAGVNGGYLDADALYYQVVRLPGEILVGDNLKATNFSETLPTEMQPYSYKIVACNGAEKKSEATETEAILYGTAFPTPYSQAFDSTTSGDLFTILNLDGGNTWTLSSWNPEYDINTTYGSSVPSDDWLITPAIRLEGGKMYKFTANLRTYAQGWPETLELAYATNYDKETGDGFTVFATWEDLFLGEFTDKAEYFLADSDGDYNIGLHYISDPSVGSMIRLASVAVEEVGYIQAPDAVSDLVIIPDADDALAATIQFTVPATSLDGNSITGITSAKVYRDGAAEPVYTFGALTAGTQASWIDTEVPTVGMHSYAVVPENEFGAGKKTEAEAFISVYTAPYSASFVNDEDYTLWSVAMEGVPEGSESNVTFGKSWRDGLCLSYFASSLPVEFMMYSPAVKLEDETVYTVAFDLYNGNYEDSDLWEYGFGLSDGTIDGFEKQQPLVASTSYSFLPQECEIVVAEGGKKHLSWYVMTNKEWHYIDMAINNISLQREASALAPYSITDFSAKPDATGLNKATLTFKAPKVDYVGRDISSITSLNIYRGNNAIPVATFENPTLGESLSWLDQEALSGNNVYTLVAINEYGRGKSYADTVYVGYDIPNAVTDFSIIPTTDNQKPQLSWTAPTIGINGGIIDTDNLVYYVIQMDPNATDEADMLSILASTTSTSITVDRTPTDYQAIEYYGVIAMTNQGTSALNYAYTILGQPYELPFAESFPQGELTTSPWLVIDYTADVTSASTVAGEGMTNYSAEPQDGDNGAFYFYNGSYYETFSGATIASPKITLGGKEATLSLWVLHRDASVYSQAPQLLVQVTTDEVNFDLLETITVSDGSLQGWQKYEIDLSAYKDDPTICLLLTGKTSGYNDVLYIDNLRIDSTSGIADDLASSKAIVKGLNGAIMVNGMDGQTVSIYDLTGRMVDSFTVSDNQTRQVPHGIYLVNVSGTTYKVAVK